MKKEHLIIQQIMDAQKSSHAADDLVRQYMPFIRSETQRVVSSDSSDYEDCLSIAMFGFYEALMAYKKSKGAFLSFAAVVIKNRLIDYKRKENKYIKTISLDAETSDEDGRSIVDKYDTGENNISLHEETLTAKKEITEFSEVLKKYGLELTDIADNCPKQKRTLVACLRALEYAKKNPELIKILEETGKLPLIRICEGTGISKKVLERHRKYLVAVFLAYTNGFEIIRGHLKELSQRKGGNE